MKREQLDGRFIVCRTQDELDFVRYHVERIFDKELNIRHDVPLVVRTYNVDGYGQCGYASIGFWNIYGYKEEECSVLFGNLVKEWVKNGRTSNGNSVS